MKFKKQLEKQLEMLGDVDTGKFSDGSASWVNLELGDMVLEFSFDGEGKMLKQITLFKEIRDVVDTKVFWQS